MPVLALLSDVTESHVGLVVLVAGVLFFAVSIHQGFKRLAGAAQPNLRARLPGQSRVEWLMGSAMLGQSSFALPARRVRVRRSAAANDEWDATVPPQLAATHQSHLWLGERLSAWIFPDIVICPTPVEIHAPASMVWEVLLDFDKYHEWNGCVRAVEHPPPLQPPLPPAHQRRSHMHASTASRCA